MLKSKQKYIIGMATAAILFTSPLTSAAEDDDIVIFGDNLEPVRTEETKTSKSSKPVVVEKPSETSKTDVVEKSSSNTEENKNNQKIEIKESEKPSEENNQNSNDNERNSENNSPIEKIDGNPAVNNLNNNENNNDEEYILGENINFSKETNKNNKENVDIIESFDNDSNDSNKNINSNSSDVKSYSKNLENSNSDNNYSSIRQNTNSNTNNKNQTGEQKVIKARFIKLLSDDNYDYYLDRYSVNWVKIPYFSDEYMADVWIRMLDRTQNEEEMPNDLYNYTHEVSDEVSEAAAKGKIYNEVDTKVLRTKKYFLEHYYLRPKTKQIQFLCELEIVGRPQNAVSERAYDYKNWENLIPGSVEFAIYYGVISDIGTSKASTRGHRTFIDMLDEYARIALN